ncbi:hypothetical protein PL78_04865 [Yersinia entomophaga]|uniref:30S ribosomal protein S8 n=1 Tax=Yersinia entomophaga TaxID=935293 RepID=A0ABN4PPM0_YERET|nr:hypothetical protein PL78_04865 [Yersinia entomophaga]OWF89216.1 hypothetical protein B4914_04900 [Yersinia entomophaga]
MNSKIFQIAFIDIKPQLNPSSLDIKSIKNSMIQEIIRELIKKEHLNKWLNITPKGRPLYAIAQ